MDAHALLTSQGWRGKGHSLHSSNDSIGLARPLLVSQKQNTLGVGKKQHRTSDMWWMNAFDKTLKGLDTSKDGAVVQTVSNGGLDMVKKGGGRFVGTGGLYASFVRGETLVGTVKVTEVDELDMGAVVDKNDEKKRARKGETKEERRQRKLEKRRRRAAKTSNTGTSTPSDQDSNNKETNLGETKEQRKERKRLKRASKAEAAVSQDSSDTPPSNDDAKKKKRKS